MTRFCAQRSCWPTRFAAIGAIGVLPPEALHDASRAKRSIDGWALWLARDGRVVGAFDTCLPSDFVPVNAAVTFREVGLGSARAIADALARSM